MVRYAYLVLLEEVQQGTVRSMLKTEIRVYIYMVQRRWAPPPPNPWYSGIPPPPVVWVGGVVEVLVVLIIVVEAEVVV